MLRRFFSNRELGNTGDGQRPVPPLQQPQMGARIPSAQDSVAAGSVTPADTALALALAVDDAARAAAEAAVGANFPAVARAAATRAGAAFDAAEVREAAGDHVRFARLEHKSLARHSLFQWRSE